MDKIFKKLVPAFVLDAEIDLVKKLLQAVSAAAL
jgi:hypothetical protein